MRDFFIEALELIIGFFLIAASVFVAVVAIGALFGGVTLGGGLPTIEGPWAAVIFAVSGTVVLLAVGGALYLGLGIYANTRRTADALELLITLRR
ncbi:MAG: hypothetical protein AAF366_01610 [Pseudomonadota bacterium]